VNDTLNATGDDVISGGTQSDPDQWWQAQMTTCRAMQGPINALTRAWQ